MKIIFGVVGLLIVLAIIGSLAKTQLQQVRTLPAVPGAAAASALPEEGTPTVREQAQNIQQSTKQTVERALQQSADRAASEAQ